MFVCRRDCIKSFRSSRICIPSNTKEDPLKWALKLKLVWNHRYTATCIVVLFLRQLITRCKIRRHCPQCYMYASMGYLPERWYLRLGKIIAFGYFWYHVLAFNKAVNYPTVASYRHTQSPLQLRIPQSDFSFKGFFNLSRSYDKGQAVRNHKTFLLIFRHSCMVINTKLCHLHCAKGDSFFFSVRDQGVLSSGRHRIDRESLVLLPAPKLFPWLSEAVTSRGGAGGGGVLSGIIGRVSKLTLLSGGRHFRNSTAFLLRGDWVVLVCSDWKEWLLRSTTLNSKQLDTVLEALLPENGYGVSVLLDLLRRNNKDKKLTSLWSAFILILPLQSSAVFIPVLNPFIWKKMQILGDRSEISIVVVNLM